MKQEHTKKSDSNLQQVEAASKPEDKKDTPKEEKTEAVSNDKKEDQAKAPQVIVDDKKEAPKQDQTKKPEATLKNKDVAEDQPDIVSKPENVLSTAQSNTQKSEDTQPKRDAKHQDQTPAKADVATKDEPRTTKLDDQQHVRVEQPSADPNGLNGLASKQEAAKTEPHVPEPERKPADAGQAVIEPANADVKKPADQATKTTTIKKELEFTATQIKKIPPGNSVKAVLDKFKQAAAATTSGAPSPPRALSDRFTKKAAATVATTIPGQPVVSAYHLTKQADTTNATAKEPVKAVETADKGKAPDQTNTPVDENTDKPKAEKPAQKPIEQTDTSVNENPRSTDKPKPDQLNKKPAEQTPTAVETSPKTSTRTPGATTSPKSKIAKPTEKASTERKSIVKSSAVRRSSLEPTKSPPPPPKKEQHADAPKQAIKKPALVNEPVKKTSGRLPRVATIPKRQQPDAPAEHEKDEEKPKKRVSRRSMLARLTAPTASSARKQVKDDAPQPEMSSVRRSESKTATIAIKTARSRIVRPPSSPQKSPPQRPQASSSPPIVKQAAIRHQQPETNIQGTKVTTTTTTINTLEQDEDLINSSVD